MLTEVTFGEWLKRQRNGRGLTQEQLAHQIGCAIITLRKLESEERRPSAAIVEQLTKIFEIPQNEQSNFLKFARGDWTKAPSSRSDEKPWQSSKPPHTNLPVHLTSFIGREKEQGEVIDLITKHRLVTLIGPGGVGKTRLSLKIGEQLMEKYDDGVWLVEYAPILDPLLVPRTTAIAIGLRDEPQRPVIDMLSDYLHGKSMIIILDNCEHLLDACAQLADTLLKRCPKLRMLATSREALGILGEANFPVPSLELPDLQQLIEKIKHYESVRLFEERAQLIRMDFALTIENIFSVVKICNQLDGIPLAIELAAARMGMFSTEKILESLQHSFNLLSVGNRTALPRHQTLRAAIDWSFDLLSPAEQTLFRRLSVFVNGWTLEAAEVICSDANINSEMILDVLTQIANKSLVIVEKTQANARYRMLETIRQYANEKLEEADETHILRDRHLQYFLHLAETAESHLIRPEQTEWLFVLDANYENLRLALDWAMGKGVASPMLRLCASLGYFWEIRGYWVEGANLLATALAIPDNNQDDTENVARVRALYQDANIADALDNLERLKNSSELALRLAKDHSGSHDIAIARLYTGLALFKLQDFDKAIPCLEESANEFQVLNDPYWEAYANMWLGGTMSWSRPINKDQGRLIDYSLRSVELARKAGERFRLARALIAYSFNLSRDEKVDEAKKHLVEAQKVIEEIGSISEPFDSIQIGLAEIEWLEGNRPQAKAILKGAQARLHLFGDKITSSYCLQKLGLLSMEEGNLEQAQIYLEDALSIAQDVGLESSVAERLILISTLFYLQGDKEESRQNFRKSIHLTKNLSLATKIDLLANLFTSPFFETSENGVILLGALDSSQKETQRRLTPLTNRYPARAKLHARNSIAQESFESAFKKGQMLSLDEALDLALKTVEEM